MKKIKFRKILILVLWITVASSVVLLLGFVSAEEKNTKGKSLNINITNQDENLFIDESDIIAYLKERNDTLINQRFKDIDVNAIEKALNTHPAIAKADVSVDVDGRVDVKIVQRKPVVRVMNMQGESYYIDNSARLMPLSENYSARVLIANGEIRENYSMFYTLDMNKIEKDSVIKAASVLDDIYATATYIVSDSLLNNLIQQIYVNKEKELELYPAVGGHKIIFGTTENMKEKFEKLKVFYKEGLNSINSWNKYSIINLKYKNQVVCIKK